MPSAKGQAVLEYISKFPNHGDRTVANALYAKWPEFWSDAESCRTSVRYYRGHQGQKARKERSNNEGSEHMTDATGDTTPYRLALPEALDNFGDSDPVTLRSSKTLILSDIHAPYHHVPSLEAAINEGLKRGVTAVILNGDILDFFAVSRWEKDPRRRDLAREIEIGRDLLKVIRGAFPGKQIIFKKGNHEERWESYLSNKAPELLGVDDFETASIFRLKELNMRVLDNRQHIRLGSLNVLHGHEFGKSIFSPVNAARGLFLRAKTSAIIGHYHQTAEHTEKDMNDNSVACFSTGCLCDLRPDYARYNKWNHGFAIVESDDDHYGVSNLKVIGGRVV